MKCLPFVQPFLMFWWAVAIVFTLAVQYLIASGIRDPEVLACSFVRWELEEKTTAVIVKFDDYPEERAYNTALVQAFLDDRVTPQKCTREDIWNNVTVELYAAND